MALSISQTVALGKILKVMLTRSGMRVASMGYPDIIAPLPAIGILVDLGRLEYREDSKKICHRHGLKERDIPDAHSFFRLFGYELDVYDVVQERGCEIILDLNEPCPYTFQYDIVLDVGTLEHCFNIAQALSNMAMMVKEGGTIIHENPFNCGNHGFYNLNPTLFNDFYDANGFKVLECKLVTRDGRAATVPATERFSFTAEEVNVFAMAKRLKVQPLRYPVQTKYAKLIPAAGVSGERAASERAKEIANG